MKIEQTRLWQQITLVVLFIGYAGYYVCRSNLSVVTPLLLQDQANNGLRKEDIGAIVSVGVLVYAVGKVGNGVLADFLGGRLMFLFGMAASVLCTVAFGVGQGLAFFLVVWSINRYVQSMGWGALVKIASRWFSVSIQATVMGVLAMSYLLGDAAARWYLGWFVRWGMDWRNVFLVSAATLAVITLASMLLLRSSPVDVGGTEPAAHPDNLFGAAGNATRPEGLATLLPPLLGDPVFWLACWLSAGLTLIRETFTFWTPTYLAEVAGLDAGRAAQYSMFFPLLGAGSALVAGLLADRLQGKYGRVALPAMVGLTLVLSLFCQAGVEGKPLLALVLISSVSAFLMAPYSFCSGIVPLQLGGKRGSSTAAGLIDSAGYVGAIASGYGVGALAQNHGWPVAFAGLAGVSALTTAAAMLLWLWQESPRRIEQSQSEGEIRTDRMSQQGSTDVVATILRLFEERGSAQYHGEAVSQTEHALQCAWAAEKSGADSALIAAALLHDVGHLLHKLPEDCAEKGIDDRHEELGARWLEKHFGPAVSEPVRLHVPAKRYLCATEPGYLERLSPASRLSLELQGGAFVAADVDKFQANPHARAALALRRWDEAAKIAGLVTPDLEHFRTYLEEALAGK